MNISLSPLITRGLLGIGLSQGTVGSVGMLDRCGNRTAVLELYFARLCQRSFRKNFDS